MTATDLLTIDTVLGLIVLIVAVGLATAFRRRYRREAGGVSDLVAGILVALVIVCLVLIIVVNEPINR